MDDRPGIYLRLEVGVSWPRHTTKRRSISYTSGAIRDHQHQQTLPAAGYAWTQPQGTQHCGQDQAYLQHVYEHASRSTQQPIQSHNQMRHLAAPTHDPVTQPSCTTTHMFTHSNGQQACHAPYADHICRRSRSASSRNSRGSSAPPPNVDRPWDADPEPMTSTALPTRTGNSNAPSKARKPLPATPNQFRIGDDEMPWSGSPDPAAYSAVEESRRGQAEASDPSVVHPVQVGSFRRTDDQDRGRTVEMQSLATALMTVDNGFEDQWWFQGPRMVAIAGDLIPPAALRDMYEHSSDPREFISLPAEPRFQSSTPTSTIVDLVSPLSGFSSPASWQSRLET